MRNLLKLFFDEGVVYFFNAFFFLDEGEDLWYFLNEGLCKVALAGRLLWYFFLFLYIFLDEGEDIFLRCFLDGGGTQGLYVFF